MSMSERCLFGAPDFESVERKDKSRLATLTRVIVTPSKGPVIERPLFVAAVSPGGDNFGSITRLSTQLDLDHGE
jgi:hypothetical protein